MAGERDALRVADKLRTPSVPSVPARYCSRVLLRCSLPDVVFGSSPVPTSVTSPIASAHLLDHVRLDRHGDLLALGRVVLAGLGDDDDLFRGRTRHREHDDVALAHAGHVLDQPLDALRVVVPAVDDEHVLLAARDVQVAVGDVAEVAGTQPAVVARAAEHLARLLVVAEVTGRDRGSA